MRIRTLLAGLAVALLADARRRERAALARSAEHGAQYRLLAENATDMIARVRPDGVLLYVSPASRTVLGRTPEELVGRNWRELVHPEDLAPNGAPRNAVVEAPDISTATLRLRHRDGQWVWVETTVRHLRDPATGAVVESQSATRDITARMLAEERLHRSEWRFRSAFDRSLVAMCLTAPDGTLLRVNPRLCELLGRDEGELVGTALGDLTHPDDPDTSVEEVRAALVGTNEAIRLETRYVHADGSPVWVELTSSLVRDEARRPLYFVTQMVDVGERRRALEREHEQVEALTELHRLKDEFVSVVSHELRTPLTSIDGYLDLALEEEGGTSEQVRAFLQTASRNAARLRRVVEDLLLLNQIDLGRLELALGEVELGALVREAAGAIAPAAGRQGVTVELEAGPGPVVVSGDADRLGQALDNLLSNAVKFTPRGGRVVVRLERDEAAACIAVADTGIGIAPGDLDRLCERFFRASSAGAHAIQGTGLGLAIARTMVEMHGGALSVESEEGRGSTFTLTFPLAPAAAFAA